MKTKTYKIVNTLSHCGETSISAKHRIGRVGKIQRLIKGMRMEFVYEETGFLLTTSTVDKFEKDDKLLKVYTNNTIYILEEV